ncbi:peptidylprolyl isomerase [Marinobacter sp. SS21]|nr:peptidylprolyl isomerase [Marinobacter sp. SS21]MDC0663347.1 peptidylprolyl isomerase [Marinobacter sp. SS21]
MVVTALFAINASADDADSPPALPKVRVETSQGVMEITLRPDVAPKTVENFLSYVDAGYYQGTIFHRVIPGFMVQGGGFDENLNRQPTEAPIVNEASPTLKNLRGTIAMARTNDPHSATSQFFINLVDNHFLNAGARGPGYAVFGRVTEGMGVADAIAGQPTGYRKGMADVPVTPIVIQQIRRIDNASE